MLMNAHEMRERANEREKEGGARQREREREIMKNTLTLTLYLKWFTCCPSSCHTGIAGVGGMAAASHDRRHYQCHLIVIKLATRTMSECAQKYNNNNIVRMAE